ncbi:unnamed protein product, partial [marine sediment metagenome]
EVRPIATRFILLEADIATIDVIAKLIIERDYSIDNISTEIESEFESRFLIMRMGENVFRNRIAEILMGTEDMGIISYDDLKFRVSFKEIF